MNLFLGRKLKYLVHESDKNRFESIKSIDLSWFNKNKCITHSKNKIKRGLVAKNKR
ncbi:hypothetical protein BCR42DRAFT_409220, partial [Absidia repens]